MTTVLYLHGFLSSPASDKVRILREHAPTNVSVVAPDLNLMPLEADQLINETIQALKTEGDVVVAGSSLGGFYAARAAKRHGLRSVLFNPCVNPWAFVRNYLGHQVIHGTERTVEVLPRAVDDFMALADAVSPASVEAARTLVVLGTADEVLDWRVGARAFAHCPQVVLPGEDHRISHFEALMPRVWDFILHET